MATGLYPLRLLQLGLEGTPGSAAAATQKIVGMANFLPIIERDFDASPRGVRAPVTGGGYDRMKATEINVEQDLTYEEIVYPMLLGLHNDAAPVDQGSGGPYLWTFEPVLNGQASIKTATAEFVVDDGSTKHYQREATYCHATSIEIEIAAAEIAKCRYTLRGRAEQSSTVTADLTPVPGRTVVPGSLFGCYIDDTAAELGDTLAAATVRSATLTIPTGIEADFTLDGRSDLDLVTLLSKMLAPTLELTLEHNAIAAAEMQDWRDGATRFVRLVANNGGAGTAEKEVSIDLAAVYAEAPQFSEDDGIEIMTATLRGEYDPTWTKMIAVNVLNALSAQP